MKSLDGVLTILTIGAAGAILYTLVTHPNGVKALFGGVDTLLTSSYNASLGHVGS